MPKLRNQEAWAESKSGERFEEFDVKIDGNVVTCYIISEMDKVCSLSLDSCSESDGMTGFLTALEES